jgi:hypothetical protein
MRVDLAVYFFAFVCVSAKVPKKIRSIQVLFLIITFYGRVLRSIILRWASEGRELFGCNNRLFKQYVPFISHTTPSSISHALEIFVSGIPKTQQRPSMIDLLAGQHRGSLTIVAIARLRHLFLVLSAASEAPEECQVELKRRGVPLLCSRRVRLSRFRARGPFRKLPCEYRDKHKPAARIVAARDKHKAAARMWLLCARKNYDSRTAILRCDSTTAMW